MPLVEGVSDMNAVWIVVRMMGWRETGNIFCVD